MTVFKYFFKILNNYKGMLFLYTILLILFSVFNMSTSEQNSFVVTKPTVYVENLGQSSILTDHFVSYLEKTMKIKTFSNSNVSEKDALFYRDIHAIITIPENYNDFFNKKSTPIIMVESTGDANAYYVEMLVEQYLKLADIYKNIASTDNEFIEMVSLGLENKSKVIIDANIDNKNLSKATFFYDFLNYSVLAGCIFVISMVLNSFHKDAILKRNAMGSLAMTKINLELYLGCFVFTFLLWLLYVGVSIILIPKVMFSINGIGYLINSFAFMLCALSIGFCIGNLLNNKEAINGIVNVIALGCSFLCGCFVPMDFLPAWILRVAHVLPSYYYISNNDFLGKVDKFSWSSWGTFIDNIVILILFSLFFFILSNYITYYKRKNG